MKAELEIGDIEAIANKVAEKILSFLGHNNNGDDELLDIEQASKFLGTSREQIYQWVSNSKHGLRYFPYLKSGKRLRFSKKALVQWMNDKSNPLEKR